MRWLIAPLMALLFCISARALAQAEEPSALEVFAADDATFVVQRRRPQGDAIEGFVVDRDALVATLRTRVLEEQGLGKLAHVAAVNPARKPGWGRSLSKVASNSDDEYLGFGSTYAFSHRFATPFERLQARVDLAPLDADAEDGRLLYLLVLGIACTIVLGLYALYRAVAVQVRFAQRRNNFVAAVSHELKTPLTAIRMYGEMLRDDLLFSTKSNHATSPTLQVGRFFGDLIKA